jgi:hypothetical protein
MTANENRLRQLLDRVLDRTCTDAELDEFSNLVDDNRELAEDLVGQLRLNSLLRWNCDALKRVVPLPGAGETAGVKSTITTLAFKMLDAKHWQWKAAAAVLIAASLVAWQWSVRAKTGAATVADVVEDDHIVWSDTSTALAVGGKIKPGKLEMKSGNLTLRFLSGATMWASGPTSMIIESNMLVRLERGQATAKVPAWAKGFTIKTSDVEVVDLGTKFGVMARENGGATDVVVFEGQVDLKPIAQSTGSEKRLNQGEGVRVSTSGAMERIVELRRDTAGGRWTTESPNWSDTTFKSIRDNIPSDDMSTYYQITPHGLEDDCHAYTDCIHEWNGLTSAGLPDELLHADYVMTRNDYRYINEFRMNVELARPATVYVFFDTRVPAPGWLSDQFEKTDIQIGLDEGPWDGGGDEHSVAVGGGQSLDNVFNVWRRRCEHAETIELGPVGRTRGARAMYGVAAKPLDFTD